MTQGVSQRRSFICEPGDCRIPYCFLYCSASLNSSTCRVLVYWNPLQCPELRPHASLGLIKPFIPKPHLCAARPHQSLASCILTSCHSVHMFVFIYRWSWTFEPSGFTSWVLGLQTCTTTSRHQTQAFLKCYASILQLSSIISTQLIVFPYRNGSSLQRWDPLMSLGKVLGLVGAKKRVQRQENCGFALRPTVSELHS